MKGYARVASMQDALDLAPRMREADKQEVRASHGVGPLDALTIAFKASSSAYTMVLDGEIVGMFGVAPGGEEGAGSPWMLCSDKFYEGSRQFARECREWIARLHEGYPLLYNYVDARNTRAIRWLRWCGFRFFAARPYGVEGRPFHEFCRINPCV